MKHEFEKIAEEIREERISAEEMIGEILPVLKELFVAKCRICSDGISLRFPNGQRAIVAVWFDRETTNPAENLYISPEE